jgi:gamma-glutamyltranspeptidase/glutathione hydrolase
MKISGWLMARAVCGALAFAALAGCTNESAPEPAAAKGEAMVAAADPLAVEAGLEILRAGGSAVDAAIAVEMVLGLVEPESSGVGGGGFLVHYRAATKPSTPMTAANGRRQGRRLTCSWSTASRCRSSWRRPAARP